jgi:hypothetical protein
VLILKPIKKPKLKSRRWYKLKDELDLLQQKRPRKEDRAAWESTITLTKRLMAEEELPGSENHRLHRVLPDNRLIHKIPKPVAS